MKAGYTSAVRPASLPSAVSHTGRRGKAPEPFPRPAVIDYTTPMIDPSPSLFSRVVIVGVGLLGASLGLAIKKRRLAHTVVGVGRAGSVSLAVAQERGAIDEASTDLAAAARTADLMVLCTPVGQFPETLRAIAPCLGPGGLVTDVGSTKAQVMAWADELLPEQALFIGSHPMAGSEKSGPAAAREDLYDHALCLLCRSTRISEAKMARLHAAGQRLERLWQAVGMRTCWLDAATHDAWVANISHLPHAAACCLVETAMQQPETLAAAASGYVDTTRLASGDVAMWTDIFLTNGALIAAAMERYIQTLRGLQQAIKTQDEPAIRHHLQAARTARDAFMARRGGSARGA